MNSIDGACAFVWEWIHPDKPCGHVNATLVHGLGQRFPDRKGMALAYVGKEGNDRGGTHWYQAVPDYVNDSAASAELLDHLLKVSPVVMLDDSASDGGYTYRLSILRAACRVATKAGKKPCSAT